LDQQITAVKASYDTFDASLRSFNQKHDEVNSDLALATSVLPSSADLIGITYESDVLTLSGVALSEDVVISYATSLRASGRFSQVVVSSMEKTCRGMGFTLILKHMGEEQ